MPDPNIIYGYRANPKNKFGSTDRMETLPQKFGPGNLQVYTRAAAAGTKYGVPQLTPEQLANMALHEGRDDFGFNEINKNNKQAMEVYQKLKDEGHPEFPAQFAGAILDKYQTAERLKKPFLEVWNGAGSKAKKYAKDSAEEMYAATHPKNESLLEYISEHYNNELNPPSAKGEEAPTMPAVDVMGNQVYKKGGVAMPQHYSSGNWKLI
jgi:hypothetical protein